MCKSCTSGSVPPSQRVDIGLAQATALDCEEPLFLEFLKVRHHAASAYTSVVGKDLLARKTTVSLPGVAEQHHIGELGAGSDVGPAKNGVGDLSEALLEALLLDDDESLIALFS